MDQQRSSFCLTTKQPSMTQSDNNIQNMVKGLSSTQYFGNNGVGEGDYLTAFQWPPRSYTCGFCKREFRSAQALGGHMNVHRKDRARLHQSPIRDDGNPSFACHYLKLPSLLPPLFIHSPGNAEMTYVSPSLALNLMKMERGKEIFEKDAEFNVRLDLEIGLIDDKGEEELDLELRLGYC